MCPYCDKNFQRRFNWQRHINETHFKFTRYECSICGKDYSRKSDAKRHSLLRHPSIKTPLILQRNNMEDGNERRTEPVSTTPSLEDSSPQQANPSSNTETRGNQGGSSEEMDNLASETLDWQGYEIPRTIPISHHFIEL